MSQSKPCPKCTAPNVERRRDTLVRPAIRRDDNTVLGKGLGAGTQVEPAGRWPANVILDCEMAEALDEQSGESTSQGGSRTASRGATQGASNGGMQGGYNLGAGGDYQPYGDSGGASRFFYVAKADASERPRLPKRSLRLRDDLTPEQVDHVRARLVEAGVQVD